MTMLVLLLLLAADTRPVADLVTANDVASLRTRGASVLPELVKIYEAGDPDRRATVARIFYELGWKSPAAKRVLMKDVHTGHTQLRLQAQWALGRVSDDDDVVDVLLANMRRDGNALFRDKAGCALAYDQVHLTNRQKLRLYEGVVAALSDENADVRRIALQVLQVHTGQTRGFQPFAAPAEREKGLAAWTSWLDEYRSQL